jgi:uncharacterized membrane protein
MHIGRLIRHLAAMSWRTRMRFSRGALAAVEDAIASAQRVHTGTVRFVVETALPVHQVLAGLTPRMRACRLFALLRLWDTDDRNGVLIHVLAADRSLEIVADRGLSRHVGPADWEAVCRVAETHFRQGRYQAGAIAAVDAIGGLLARHFPADKALPGPSTSHHADPLPHQPSLL